MMVRRIFLPVVAVFLAVSQLSCAQEISRPVCEVSVAVKNGCDQELESVHVQFDNNRTIGGALLPDKSATEGGMSYPELLDEVEVHYRVAGHGQALVTKVPLKSLVPENIEGDFEVLFTVVCADETTVETTFWQYRHDGKRYRKVQVK